MNFVSVGGTKMRTYGPKNLKEQFKELERLHDSTLIPIINRVTDNFLSDLNHNPSRYNISDAKNVEQLGEGLQKYISGGYNLVIDGKIVSMTVHRINIDDEDDDEYWWMANMIDFEGNEERSNRLVEHFKRFVGQQKLDELIRAAAEELQKGKTHHLNKEMRDFYFLSSSVSII